MKLSSLLVSCYYKKWPPAQSPTDSGNTALARLNYATTPDTFASSVLALVQKKMGDSFNKDRRCFICGATDHLANACPNKNKKASDTKKTDTPKKKNWKHVPPKEGEQQTKKVGKRTFHWCAKCNRWSTTHSTATHVNKSENAPEANLMFEPGAWCMYEGDSPAITAQENDGYPFSMKFTLGYVIMTYFFMVFYLVRNDIFRLSTIFNNIGFFSLCQSLLTFLNTFGGFTHFGDFLLSSMSVAFTWIGPFCAPLLWILISFSAFWMSSHSKATSVDIIDSRMKRRDRRTYERQVRKSLKSQLREFRPTRLPSPRIHGRYLRRRGCKKAPSVSVRNRKTSYDRIFDSCANSMRSCSKKSRSATQVRRDRRWNKSFRTHLDGIHRRKPCNKHFRNMVQHEDFASCYNASSPTHSNKSKEKSFHVIWDSGASVCFTHDRDDFINFSSNSTLSRLNSVGGGHAVHGEGEVLWSIVDSTGML